MENTKLDTGHVSSEAEIINYEEQHFFLCMAQNQSRLQQNSLLEEL